MDNAGMDQSPPPTDAAVGTSALSLSPERVGMAEDFSGRSNLALSFLCLPAAKRADMNVFYTFCRVVDDIADPTGNAYSAMPARLYVVDAAGKVAYKSGRGPFGFKPSEMEQALAMSLLEASAAKK